MSAVKGRSGNKSTSSEPRTIEQQFAVGDTVRLKAEFSGNGNQVVTITELTDRGFKYKHPRRMIDPYSWSEGGETYRPDMYERTSYIVKQSIAESSNELDTLLRDVRTALGDWITTYAYEMCNEENVKAAHDRISENGGTLAYIGDLVGRINDALEQRAADETSVTNPSGALRLVVEAARNLVASARNIDVGHAKVDEAALVALEAALAAVGEKV